MNYSNCETGKPCSRDEYIAFGLSRGECLIAEKCGCVVIQDWTADAYIVYCPLHEAAPKLYEALRRGLSALESCFQIIGSDDSFFVKHSQGLIKDMEQAIAEAEKK